MQIPDTACEAADHPGFPTRLAWPVAMVLWLVPLLLFVYGSRFLIGYDPYFHVQLSEIMRQQGVVIPRFTWVTESIWRDAWFDKEWLFHVLLMPFLALGKTAGAKVFIVVTNLGILASFRYLCRRLGAGPWAATIWTTLLPWCGYGIFWMRLAVCRPHLLSILILCLALALMVQRRFVWLGLVSFVYALSYTGHWQLLGVVLVYDVLYARFDEAGRWRAAWSRACPMLAAALPGMLVGELVHPQFPASLRGLYIQNVEVLLNAWSGAEHGGGTAIRELQPGSWHVLWLAAPLFAGLAVWIWRSVRNRQRPRREVLFLAVCTLVYLVLSVLSFRFLEYFIPVGAALLAAGFAQTGGTSCRPERWWPIFVVMTLVFGGTGYREYFQRYQLAPRIRQQDDHLHAGAGRWLRAHLQPGETVFSTRFGDNSVLWFLAPEQRYLVFLDPIFMRRHREERYILWEQVRRGQHPDPVAAITGIFGSRIVFVVADPRVPDPAQNAELRLVQQLTEAGADLVYEDPATGARLYLLSRFPLR